MSKGFMKKGNSEEKANGSFEKRSFQKKKGCRFCGDVNILIDYKNKNLLEDFITERFKIVPRRVSGNCAFHQRSLTQSIKRARHVAILAYTTAQNW